MVSLEVLRCFNDYVNFIVKYPFSKEGLARFREITSERGIYINDLANSVMGRQLLQRAYEILSEAVLKGGSITDDPDLGDDELLAHYVAVAWRRTSIDPYGEDSQMLRVRGSPASWRLRTRTA